MNILERYPNVTDEQKQALLEAEREWAEAIRSREIQGNVNKLDGAAIDPFKDFTDIFKAKIKEIINN